MTIRTWVGGTGAWDNAADWSPQGVPGASDDVVLGAGADVTISGPVQPASVTLDDLGAVLTLDFNSTLSAPGGLTLMAGTFHLGGTLANTTLRLQGGKFLGTGALDNDTIVGTLDLAATRPQGALFSGLFIQDTITLAAAPGQPGLRATADNEFIQVTPPEPLPSRPFSSAILDGGVAIVGSPDASAPVALTATNGQLTLGANLTLDVIGATELSGTAGATLNSVVNTGTIAVGPGGRLDVAGAFFSTGTINIASGTLDLSSETFPSPSAPIQMDDGAAKLVLRSGDTAAIEGFRAGDTIDIKGVSVSGALPLIGGVLAVGPDTLHLMGQMAPGAAYAAASDGAGGTLVTTTAQPAATVAFYDQATGAIGNHALDAASGGPSYLQWQYLDTGSDTVAMTAGVPNVFLKGGGNSSKALAVTTGQNVLDGGTGSAFLVGGSGRDTFFVDVRGTNAVWDTLVNFHAGDAVTVWGWSPSSGTERWDALDGTRGYQGATMRLANSPGGAVSSVSFAGLSADQAAHLQTSTGTVGGLNYLYISSPGVISMS